MSKKIAICIGGYWGSFTHKESSGHLGFKHLKETLFEKYDEVDVFIHSWQTDMKNEIVNLYRPWLKKAKFEKQINFSECLKYFGIYDGKYSLDYSYNRQNPWNDVLEGKMHTKLANYISQAFTRSQSLKLKKEYEKENNLEYDWVIQTRFDVFAINRGKTSSNKPDVSRILFNIDNDNTKVYFPFWYNFNEGMPDIWFYSNSENMNKFIDFDRKVISWLSGEGTYLKELSDGWFDTNANDEHSNEILLSTENKSKQLVKYKEKKSAHNYAMWMKQILKEEGLYHKVRIMEKITYE